MVFLTGFILFIKYLMLNFKQYAQEISKLLPKLIEKQPGNIVTQEKELFILI